MLCGSCGADNPDGTRFCMTCGQAVGRSEAGAEAPFAPPPPSASEWSAPLTATEAEEPLAAPVPPADSQPEPPPDPPPTSPGFEPAPPPPAPPPTPPPPAPAAPPAPGPPPSALDPALLGLAAGRLSPWVRSGARAALAVAGASLDVGERVEMVVAGRFAGAVGAAVLTDRGLLVVNDREWQPVVERLPVDGDLVPQGWDAGPTAALAFTHGERQLVLDEIFDQPLARELYERVRLRTGAGAPPSP